MTQPAIAKLEKILSENGHHITKARKATFNLLLDAPPLSMSQLLEKAQGTMDRVSVYRSIELFERLGIVNRMHIGWKYKLELSDQFVHHHHHLTCLDCGAVIDIEDEQHMNDFIAELCAQHGFTAQRHVFEVAGYCAPCAKLRKQSDSSK